MSSIFIIAHFNSLCKREEIKCRADRVQNAECRVQSG